MLVSDLSIMHRIGPGGRQTLRVPLLMTVCCHVWFIGRLLDLTIHSDAVVGHRAGRVKTEHGLCSGSPSEAFPVHSGSLTLSEDHVLLNRTHIPIGLIKVDRFFGLARFVRRRVTEMVFVTDATVPIIAFRLVSLSTMSIVKAELLLDLLETFFSIEQ